MSALFVALPVNQGDSFYLQRADDRSYMIDGGKSVITIPSLFNQTIKSNKLHALICTHNDSDHANGVLGMLQHWHGIINEVWLPNLWSYRLETLLKEPKFFVHEILRELSESKEWIRYWIENDLAVLDNMEKQVSQDIPTQERSDDWLIGAIEDTCELEDQWLDALSWYAPPLFIYFSYGSNLMFAFLKAVQTASRIRNIAMEAYLRGAMLRWYDHWAFLKAKVPSGGDKGCCEPVNSQEINPKSNPKMPLLYYLALTRDNRESLVFHAPESEQYPAVLFTADSPLEFALPFPPPQREFIVTVPHHGAETNAKAYKVVDDWHKGGQHWVRSDCKSKKRPGPTYKSKPNKYCTMCNHGQNVVKELVEFKVTNSNWQWQNGSRVQGCTCQ